MFLIICNKRKQATFFFSFLLYFPHTIRAGMHDIYIVFLLRDNLKKKTIIFFCSIRAQSFFFYELERKI